jgi:hypothetical protein
MDLEGDIPYSAWTRNGVRIFPFELELEYGIEMHETPLSHRLKDKCASVFGSKRNRYPSPETGRQHFFITGDYEPKVACSVIRDSIDENCIPGPGIFKVALNVGLESRIHLLRKNSISLYLSSLSDDLR